MVKFGMTRRKAIRAATSSPRSCWGRRRNWERLRRENWRISGGAGAIRGGCFCDGEGGVRMKGGVVYKAALGAQRSSFRSVFLGFAHFAFAIAEQSERCGATCCCRTTREKQRGSGKGPHRFFASVDLATYPKNLTIRTLGVSVQNCTV